MWKSQKALLVAIGALFYPFFCVKAPRRLPKIALHLAPYPHFEVGLSKRVIRDQRYLAYGGLAAIIILICINVSGTLLLAHTVNLFGNALQSATARGGIPVGEFMGIATRIIVTIVIFFVTDLLVHAVLKQLFTWYWFEALFRWYLEKWRERTSEIEGMAQRVKEGADFATADATELMVTVLRCFIGVFAFIPMTWQTSTYFYFILPIPGFIFWAMILFCAIEWYIARYLGRKLPTLEKKRQRARASLRTSLENLQHVRQQQPNLPEDDLHAMHINVHIERHMDNLQSRTFSIIFRSLPLIIWGSTYGYFWGFGFDYVIGYFVAVTLSFPLGIMWQTTTIVHELHNSLAVFTNNWQRVTKIQGTIERMMEIETRKDNRPA